MYYIIYPEIKFLCSNPVQGLRFRVLKLHEEIPKVSTCSFQHQEGTGSGLCVRTPGSVSAILNFFIRYILMESQTACFVAHTCYSKS